MEFPQYKAERMAELYREEWGALRIPGLLDLIKHCQPKRMLEIGCFRGVSTEIFLLHAGHVSAVDTWPDVAIERDFFRRCGAYPHMVAYRGKSLDVMPTLGMDELFDFCYLDGDHSYETVRAEINMALGLTTEWVAGHDYLGTGTPGVAQAVHEAFDPAKVLRFSDSSWAVKCDQ